MSKQILDIATGSAILTDWIESQADGGGFGSSKKYQLSEALALAGASDLDAVLVAGNDAAGIGITELSGIDNIVNDFELITPQGVDFYFGSSPAGVFGLDAAADQMLFTSDQWVAQSSDGNMFISMDIDVDYIELTNQSNFLRITDFDIEVGSPILGYSTTSEIVSLISTNRSSIIFKPDEIICRTTAALESCTVGGSNTTLTKVGNGAFPAQDGITISTVGQSVLVMNEADPKNNGVYNLTQVGSGSLPWILTRRGDSNPGGDLRCAVYSVEQGTRFKGTSWKQTTINPAFGTDNIVFKPFGDNILEDTVSGYYRIVSTLGVLSTTSV